MPAPAKQIYPDGHMLGAEYGLWGSGKNRYAVTAGRKALTVLGYVSKNSDGSWQVERAGQKLLLPYPSAAAAAEALFAFYLETVASLPNGRRMASTELGKPRWVEGGMEVQEALEQLEQQGHTVEYKPLVTRSERFYHIDGLPRTEGQIIAWVVDGIRPGSKGGYTRDGKHITRLHL